MYDHDEAPDSPYSVEAALNLYDLQHFEMHWDKDPTGVDTKAIVGWNNDMVGAGCQPVMAVGMCTSGMPAAPQTRRRLLFPTALGSSGHMIAVLQAVIAFRGTASLANAKADIQVGGC